MARFAALDHRLDPYSNEANIDRVDKVRNFGIEVKHGKKYSHGLTIIVLNKDAPEFLSRLWSNFSKLNVRALERGLNVELILGDTGSTNSDTLDLLRNPPDGATVHKNLLYQFSRCNNQLAKFAQHNVSLFMNNDVFFDEAIDGILDAFEIVNSQKAIGTLGAVLYFPDGTAQHVGVDFFRAENTYALPYHPDVRQTVKINQGEIVEIPAVTGAFLMVRSELFGDVGGFDERYARECQDIDLCLRIRRLGLPSKLIHAGHIIHVENGTRTIGEEDWNDRALFIRRWSSYVEALT